MLCTPLLCGFTEEEASVAQEVGLDTLSSPYLTDAELQGETPVLLWDKLKDLLSTGVSDALQSASVGLASLLGILVLCSLLHALKNLDPAGTLSSACSLVTSLAVSGVCFSLLSALTTRVGQALTLFTEYLAALLPVSSALLAAGGSVAAASVSHAAFSLFLTAVSLLCSSVLFPFLQVSFAIGLAGALPGTVDLSPLGALFRNTAAVLLAFLFSLLGFLLPLQTTIAAASDSMLFRTVRFASGVLIPVVGSALGDAARTVAGSVTVIKGTVGGVGTAVTLAVLLPPFLTVAAHKLLFSLCATLAKLLGCERESHLLAELGGTLSVLMGLLAGSEVISLLYLATLIRTGGAL